MAPTRKGSAPHQRGPGRPVGTDSGQTREHLLRVAREVLSEQGFPKTTIREIAERANVNPALLHYYFGNKSGLHSAVVEQVGKQIRANLESVGGAGGNARERLRRLIGTYLNVLAQEPYVAQMLVHHLLLTEPEETDSFIEQVGRPLVQSVIDVVEDGVTKQEFRDFDRSLLVSSIASSCLSFFLSGPLLERAGGVDYRSRGVIESWSDSMTDLLLNGLAKA